MSNFPKRAPTAAAREALALQLGLPYAASMQDWEWEVADSNKFDRSSKPYCATDLSEAERFSLMEVLLQCTEGMPTEELLERAWGRIEPHLRHNIGVHYSSATYWSCPGVQTAEACFRITPLARRMLANLSQTASPK